MPELPELQRLFWRALREQAPPADLLAMVESTPGLDAGARLDIYADAYLWRIGEALGEDFPRLAARLGADAFHALVRAYLAAQPSEHPSIAHVGRRLADFLDAGAVEAPPWAADLARLEWTRRWVFDAPDAAPLTLDDLRRIAAEEWGALRLRLVPAAATLVSGWPVHLLWQDGECGTEALVAARTAYRVWRDGFVVYHATMGATEAGALGCLAGGASFADVCERVGTPEEAGALLLSWIEDGLIARDPTASLRS